MHKTRGAGGFLVFCPGVVIRAARGIRGTGRPGSSCPLFSPFPFLFFTGRCLPLHHRPRSRGQVQAILKPACPRPGITDQTKESRVGLL